MTDKLTENQAAKAVDSIDWLDADLSDAIGNVFGDHSEYLGDYWSGDFGVTSENAEDFVKAVIENFLSANTKM